MVRADTSLCGPLHLSCPGQTSGEQGEVRCRSSLRCGALVGAGIVSRRISVVEDEQLGASCPLLDRLSGGRFRLERVPGDAVGVEVSAHDGIPGRANPIGLEGLLLRALTRGPARWGHVDVDGSEVEGLGQVEGD